MSCHFIRQRVDKDKLTMKIARMSFGSSLGRKVSICFLGFLKAMPTPEAGFKSIKPVFTA